MAAIASSINCDWSLKNHWSRNIFVEFHWPRSLVFLAVVIASNFSVSKFFSPTGKNLVSSSCSLSFPPFCFPLTINRLRHWSLFHQCFYITFLFFYSSFFLHIPLQMEMQEIHSHLRAAVSSPLLTRTMITGKSTARKHSKAVGGMACVIKPV